MSNIVQPQILPSNQGSFVTKDFKKLFENFEKNKNLTERDKGEPYVFLKDFSFLKHTFGGGSPNDLFIGSKTITENYKKDQVVFPFPPVLPNQKRILQPAFKDALDKGVLVPQKTAQQQAIIQEMGVGYSGLTDKVFGKQEGWSFERPMRLGAYIILGAVVGRYVAKNMKKSTTLGMVLGGLAPLLAYQLSIEYDKKNMPKQEPRQKVAIEPTPKPMPNKPNAMPLDPSVQELYKTPNEFTIKSNGFNTRYYKDVSKTEGIFSFASPNLYKQPYSTNGMSGVQPTKISTREFLDAYNEFLKQPK